MPVKKSPLESLIEHPQDGGSEARRELKRLCTDRLLAAADRYGIREMEFFDLLYSHTARQMDHHCRRMVVAALTKAGLSREAIKSLVLDPPSLLGQILRRSSTQSLPDLVSTIRDNTMSMSDALAQDMPPSKIYLPEHRFSLPVALLEEMYRFVFMAIAREAYVKGNGRLAPLLDQVSRQNGTKVIEDAQIEARDAILEARSAVQRRIRSHSVNEKFLEELLDSRQTLQFTFALTHMLDIDTTTMLRVLNDGSWDSLALSCRAARISRSCFSRIINSMHRRQDDHPSAQRILNLYERIPVAEADAVMRFWQIRVSALCEAAYPDALDHAEPANANDPVPAKQAARNGAGATFGRG